jgi:alpha-tubulin suppressor-like RCC1 family protein
MLAFSMAILLALAAVSCSDSSSSSKGNQKSVSAQHAKRAKIAELSVPRRAEISEIEFPLGAEVLSPKGHTTIYCGQTVTFKGSVTGGAYPYSVRWDFGNAAPSVLKEDAGEVVFSTPGTVTVYLEVTDAAGSTVKKTVNVDVIKDTKPVAHIDFPRDGAAINEGESIRFKGSGTEGNAPLRFKWNFGSRTRDSLSKDPEPVAFSRAGTFPVTLTVIDANGDTSQHAIHVVVEKNVPKASILLSDEGTNFRMGRSIKFSGYVEDGNPPFTYTWNLGGLGTSREKNPGDVTLSKPGAYKIIFTVKDAQGDQSSDTKTIRVSDSAMPSAQITSPATDITIIEGEAVDFSSRISGGDEPLKIHWDFQGCAPDSTERNPRQVRFTRPGVFHVRLRVTDADNDSSESTLKVTVEKNTVPKVSIVSPSSKVMFTDKGKVNFKGMVSEGNGPFTYTWQFGEKAREWKGKDPGEVPFTALGDYLVRFTVRDAQGDVGTATVMVSVVKDSKPRAAIELPEADIEVYEGELVWFKGYVRDGNLPISCRWDFKKGAKNASNEEPGDVIFKKEGVYPVTFTVSDADGDTDTVTRNVTVLKSSWIAASGGWSHSAAMKADGSLWAWGLNSYGQLGKGTFGSTKSPVQIGYERNWKNISVGGGFTLALKNDGSLWAWGANGKGQLGNGTLKHTTTPVQVDPDNRWKEIAAGTSHSLAIRSDGSLWAWGRNNEGQLGNGTRNSSPVPVRVGNETGWKEITAGESHSLAIRSDGSLWAWGLNELGQLGDGTQGLSTIPKQISPNDKWISVSAGKAHSIALKSDGTLWAWGANMYGQLGDCSKVFKMSPVKVGKDSNWKLISAGEYHNLALKRNGTLWAWGWNAFGQLGKGNNQNCNAPVNICLDSDWVSVDAGDQYSLAVKRDGSLWAWGYNGYSQLGCGDYEDKRAPVFVKPARRLLLSRQPYPN